MPDSKAKRLKPASDAVEILHRRFYEGKPARLKNLEEARANEEIARKIQELRAAAALTQTQLAKLIGTAASAICRLEDADYKGHSLSMLRRIAAALDKRLEIRFVPIAKEAGRPGAEDARPRRREARQAPARPSVKRAERKEKRVRRNALQRKA